MSKISEHVVSGVGTIFHSLAVPLFALIFTVYYRPFDAYEALEIQNVSSTFNVTILFCIILVSVSITRGWLYILAKYRNISRLIYMLYCIVETFVASLFGSLYIVLISSGTLNFFDVSASAFPVLLAINIFSYAFLWMGCELHSCNNQDATPVDDNTLIRFYDEYKKLRLVIATEAVMFIKSEDNYVQIYYMDQKKPRKFILRSSMKALEETLSKKGLVRCHRSYFINPAYIKIVHRDNAGLIVAELNVDGYDSIPISRKYQDVVMKLI